MGMVPLGWAYLCPIDQARAEPAGVMLAPHRAVYDFSLTKTRGHPAILDVVGRMVYELTGSPCQGYAEKLRIVTQITNDEGEATVADESSWSWEGAGSKRFRFKSSEVRNGKPVGDSEGEAVRADDAGSITVELTRPDKKAFMLPAHAYFPTQHTIALLTAARMGRASLDADVFDGSEQGEKVYHTVSSIGASLARDTHQKLASVENAKRLQHLDAWPIRVAYFDPKSDKEDAVPVYEIRSVFFENGVNREIVIDYGSFAMEGKLKEITFFEPTKCE